MYMYIHTHTYIYIYIYTYIVVHISLSIQDSAFMRVLRRGTCYGMLLVIADGIGTPDPNHIELVILRF